MYFPTLAIKEAAYICALDVNSMDLLLCSYVHPAYSVLFWV